jgi:hypothetical protein
MAVLSGLAVSAACGLGWWRVGGADQIVGGLAAAFAVMHALTGIGFVRICLGRGRAHGLQSYN